MDARLLYRGTVAPLKRHFYYGIVRLLSVQRRMLDQSRWQFAHATDMVGEEGFEPP